MKNILKVGDRVICTNDFNCLHLEKNKKYTISKIEIELGNYYVKLVEVVDEWYGIFRFKIDIATQRKEKLKNIEKMETFKVGDKVICINDTLCYKMKLNKKYTVSKTNYRFGMHYVELSEVVGEFYCEDRFKINIATQRKEKLKNIEKNGNL